MSLSLKELQKHAEDILPHKHDKKSSKDAPIVAGTGGKTNYRVLPNLRFAYAMPLVLLVAGIGIYSLLFSQAATVTCDKVASRTGLDTNAGTEASPYKTAQKVVDNLSAGQTGCLHAGVYTELANGGYVLRPLHGGTSTTAQITLRSHPSDTTKATLKGPIEFQLNSNFITLSDMNIDGSTYASNSIEIYADHINLLRNDITNKHLGGTCIYLGSDGSYPQTGPATNLLIKDNIIHECGKQATGNQEHSIYAHSPRDGEITENVFYDSTGFHIQFYTDSQRLNVHHNIFDGGSNQGGLVFAGGDGMVSSGNLVNNNIITNATGPGITYCWAGADSNCPDSPASPTGINNVANNNCLYNNKGGDISSPVGFTATGNLIATNPLYTDTSARDYTVSASSPCLAKTGYDIAKAVNNAIGGGGTGVTLGSALPPPLPESTGTQITGNSTSSLSSLFSGLTAGNRLCLHSGVYGQGLTSAVTLSVSGTATNPITIESCTGETAQIAQQIQITGSYVRLRNLKIIRNNYPTDARYSQSGTNPGGNVGIWLKGGQHVTLEKSEITGATMSGIFGGGEYNQILSNNVHDNGTTPDDHGIYYTSGNSLIANNIFYNNYDFGIQLGYTSATNNIVTNNTTVNNGYGGGASYPGSGVVTFSGTTSNIFVNNISAGNAQYGFKTYDSTNTLSHNLAYGNASGTVNGTFASVTSMLVSNPLFVSANDFHLKSGSPVIGSGDSSYTPTTDLAGNIRSTADLGAYSAGSTPTCPTKQGDVNGDGSVNITDISALLSAYGQTTTNCADLDKNGTVNIQDLSIILSKYGT